MQLTSARFILIFRTFKLQTPPIFVAMSCTYVTIQNMTCTCNTVTMSKTKNTNPCYYKYCIIHSVLYYYQSFH